MYIIHTKTEQIWTDSIAYIKPYAKDCYILASREDAEGVNCKGVNYWFKDGVTITACDASNAMQLLGKELENAICELDRKDVK